MEVTIRVEITNDWDETDTFEICQLDRPYRQLEPDKVVAVIGRGKDLLHRLQKIDVASQAEEVCTLRRFCTRCHRFLELKDRRIRKVDPSVACPFAVPGSFAVHARRRCRWSIGTVR
ncbi:hypothetical protein SAMN05446934_9270 [Paraburkholderia hospita]|nr:hypothetical protein SAMN05446934_9270 [Paraburkholderia hospita]